MTTVYLTLPSNILIMRRESNSSAAITSIADKSELRKEATLGKGRSQIADFVV